MKALLLLIAASFMSTANAYEGQPAGIYMMMNPAQTILVNMPEIRFSDLTLEMSDKCSEKCYGSFIFPEGTTTMIGNSTYSVERVFTRVSPEGEIVQPMKFATLIMRESLTGTILTINFGDRKVTCFGGRPKGLCTDYAVVTSY